MAKREAWTLIEAITVLLVIGFLLALTGSLLRVGLDAHERRTERRILTDQIEFGLNQIEKDAQLAVAITSQTEMWPPGGRLNPHKLYFLQWEKQPEGKNSYRLNEVKRVEYGLKNDDFIPPSFAPKRRKVLYRSETLEVASVMSNKEPIAQYLNGDSVPPFGFYVQGYDVNGESTFLAAETHHIVVTLSGKTKNGQLISGQRRIIVGNGKGVKQ